MPERYREEIEEILRQAGELSQSNPRAADKPTFWRLVWRYGRESLCGKAWSVSPGRVMLAALVLLLAALVLNILSAGSVAPVAWAGLVLFIVGYGMFFVRPPRVEKRWRGQVLDQGGSWWDRHMGGRR